MSLRDLRPSVHAVGLGAQSVRARRDRRATIGVESMEGLALLSMVSLVSASGGLRGVIEDPNEAMPIRGVEDPTRPCPSDRTRTRTWSCPSTRLRIPISDGMTAEAVPMPILQGHPTDRETEP